MNLNINILYYIAAAVFIVAVPAIALFKAFNRIDALEKKLDDAKKYNEDLLNRKTDRINKQIESIKGSIEVLSSANSKQISDIFKRVDRCEVNYQYRNSLTESINKLVDRETKSNEVLIKAINRLVEVVDNLCDRESEDWVGSDSEAVSEASGDTDGDQLGIFDIVPNEMKNKILGQFEEKKTDIIHQEETQVPVYRWVFPTDLRKENLVYGQWYLVVGNIEGQIFSESKEPMLMTEEGFWNGHEFVTIKDEKFTRVYAYILPPDSSDIMEKIVQMKLEEN